MCAKCCNIKKKQLSAYSVFMCLYDLKTNSEYNGWHQFPHCKKDGCRFQWPCGLRRRSAADRLLGLWVRIPPGTWMFVCCELTGIGLCEELITRPEESYRVWGV